MSRKEIYDQLTEIFRDLFDDDEIVLSDDTTADDIEDWDSLEQINLLVAIEKRFKIKFQLADVSHLENVGAMVNLVEKLIK
ncbi:MAG: acyl carrier protein [Oscillospiraceae bacterium]